MGSTGYPIGSIKVLKVNVNDDWGEEVLTSDDINFVDGITASGGNLIIQTTTDHDLFIHRNGSAVARATSTGLEPNSTGASDLGRESRPWGAMWIGDSGGKTGKMDTDGIFIRIGSTTPTVTSFIYGGSQKLWYDGSAFSPWSNAGMSLGKGNSGFTDLHLDSGSAHALFSVSGTSTSIKTTSSYPLYLGSHNSDQIYLDYSDNSLHFLQSTFVIVADTVDGSDDSIFITCGGGGSSSSRGSTTYQYGNDHSTNGGQTWINCGNISGANLYLQTIHSDAEIKLLTNSTTRWSVSSSGNFVPFADDTYDIGTSSKRANDVWSTGGIKSFTGEHIYLCKDGEDLLPGEAVSLKDGKIERCTSEKDTTCIGIIDKYIAVPVSGIYDSMHQLAPEGSYVSSVIAVGDNYTSSHKGFNICNENGNIQAGDLLVTASGYAGFLKKQDDDLMRSYTVGKSLQDITFSGSDTISGVYGVLYCG